MHWFRSWSIVSVRICFPWLRLDSDLNFFGSVSLILFRCSFQCLIVLLFCFWAHCGWVCVTICRFVWFEQISFLLLESNVIMWIYLFSTFICLDLNLLAFRLQIQIVCDWLSSRNQFQENNAKTIYITFFSELLPCIITVNLVHDLLSMSQKRND